MPESQVESSTKDWFTRKFGVLDNDTLSRLLSVKQVYNFSNDDVYVNWEAFVVTQEDGEMDPSLANVEKFEGYLQETVASSNQKKTPSLKKARDVAGAKRKPMMDFSSSPGVVLPSTPQLKKRRPVLTSEPDSSPSKEAPLSSPRKLEPVAESNSVVETLNPHVEMSHFAPLVKVQANFEAKKFGFRTMAMKLLESADVLDEQIDSMSEKIQAKYADGDVVLSNPCLSSQFDILCCGRIVPDSPFYDPLHQQALNDKSLYLETSRLGGIGQRIPLDVSQLGQYSFFPGQIVGLKGRNPTGRVFVVHEVLDFPELGMPVLSKEDLEKAQPNGPTEAGENNENSENSALATKVFVAAGPFSNPHTLNYDKLAALVDRINTEIQPQVAVLLGPFLDLTNKTVESGDVEIDGVAGHQQPRTLDEVFRMKVTPILKRIAPHITVVMIPSVKDAASKHTSYPQAGFDRRKLGLPKNFRCYPNPSGFYVNEALFKVSNTDVFKDLKDVFKPGAEDSTLSSNRFDRIATHIFQQNRFYPMFPGSVKHTPVSQKEKDHVVAIKDGVMAEDLADIAIGGACLEVPYLGLTELDLSLPDVMIIPSEMKYFAKVIGGVVVVNPGQFIRPSKDASREDGSYTVMSIKPANENEAENIEKTTDGSSYFHNVFKRCRVDIHKS